MNFCYGIYFSKFHAICKWKFQNCVHIYILAIHSHSALIFRLRCISTAISIKHRILASLSTVDSRYLEFHGTLEKIRVNRTFRKEFNVDLCNIHTT
jgi:hypothetical protein